MGTLAWIVVRETGDRIAGLVAAGLFAASFQVSGSWFDVGRVDSLFLALTLAALAWGRWARGVSSGIGVGLLAFLAFFTKQTALIALAPALGFLVLTRRRAGVPALLMLVGLLVASTAALDAASNGWYRYYVFDELAGQPWVKQLWLGFWVDDILRPEWPLVLLLIAGGATVIRRRRALGGFQARALYWAAAAAGLLASAWLSRLHTGGYANVLMPAYAATALLAGLLYAALTKGRRAVTARPLIAVALLVQLGLVAYQPGAQIPTAADRATGNQLIARLRALPGPVIVPRHPWYATVAGKGTFAQEEALDDVLRSEASRGARALWRSLRNPLNDQNIQAVVLDGTFDAHFLSAGLRRDFRLQPRPITPSPLYPLTDARTAPTLLYRRVHPAPESAFQCDRALRSPDESSRDSSHVVSPSLARAGCGL
jgi:hypothetical protein